MDRATVYDKAYYNAALKSGITCQPKAAVAGGNNSGAVHTSRSGVRTLAISVPCRYIHSPASVADKCDIENALRHCRNICLKAFAAAKLNDKACKRSARGFKPTASI